MKEEMPKQQDAENKMSAADRAYVESVKKEWEKVRPGPGVRFDFTGVWLEAYLPPLGDEHNAKLALLQKELPKILGNDDYDDNLEYRRDGSGFRVFERSQTFGRPPGAPKPETPKAQE